jgi:hypothetical protein
MILRHGANLDAQDNNGRTAADVATRAGHIDIAGAIRARAKEPPKPARRSVERRARGQAKVSIPLKEEEEEDDTEEWTVAPPQRAKPQYKSACAAAGDELAWPDGTRLARESGLGARGGVPRPPPASSGLGGGGGGGFGGRGLLDVFPREQQRVQPVQPPPASSGGGGLGRFFTDHQSDLAARDPQVFGDDDFEDDEESRDVSRAVALSLEHIRSAQSSSSSSSSAASAAPAAQARGNYMDLTMDDDEA